MNAALLAGCTIIRNWPIIRNSLPSVESYVFFTIASGLTAAFAFVGLLRSLRTRPQDQTSQSDVASLKPLFFPSKTTHARLIPKRHSFSYSYLLAGIPIGWRGSAGGLLSSDADESGSSFGGGWYKVKAEDYLDRGFGHLGLRGKLSRYLQKQGFGQDIDPADYPYAYLMTAPKLMGYSFNPVSFWYLYNAERQLSALILEVNNTFDERRNYLLMPDPEPVEERKEAKFEDEEFSLAIAKISEPARKPPRFTNTWAKDFHVSPFSSRKGSYSLVAFDPLYPSFSGAGPVNSTITLTSSKDDSKLVARVFSTGAAIDPTILTPLQKLNFLASWWWVGFFTFPRVLREAAMLAVKRKLHIFYRPEPLKGSMSRRADSTEEVLESSFRAYLRHLVSSAANPLVVRYTAAGVSRTEEIMTSPSAPVDLSDDAEVLGIEVLTPIFYTRFVRYAHDLEALCCESLENNTLFLSRPDLLPRLVLRAPSPLLSSSHPTNYLLFTAIRKLRRRPARLPSPPSQPAATTDDAAKQSWNPSSSRATTTKDLRTFRMSPLDAFILSHTAPPEQRRYRWALLKLLLSDRVASGEVANLDAEMLLVRVAVAWFLAGRVVTIAVWLLEKVALVR
ncbi:MAG: hypothetical protein M1818_004464 [Claussenomyces sp. TS43310]|nr:MAG: hypothetical protein M1818_004464 [Claussenomyces sp. TS43310]